MRENIIKAVRIILFLAIGIIFLLIAFRDISIEDLMSGLRSASYEWVFLSLLFATLAFISRAYRWILLIQPLGYGPSLKNSFHALMTGYLANFILPRIGEITRCTSLNRTERIPVGSLLGTVIIDRLSDLFVLMLLVLSVFFINIELFGNFLFNQILQPLYLRASSLLNFHLGFYILIVSAILMLLLFYRINSIRLKKFSIYRRLEKIILLVRDGMKSLVKMKKKLHFILHTIFIWLMYYLMTWSVFNAMPSTSELGSAAVLFIMVIGGMAMSVPVQGGIGAYHWIVSMGLGLYNIPREEGLVFATLSHESQALLMIILGSVSMIMVFTKHKKVNNSNHSDKLLKDE